MRGVLSEKESTDAKSLMAVHGARNLRVLDSCDRAGTDAANLVFLVEMDAGRNLFDLVALTEDLREALGPEVEVLTEGSISPYLRDRVLAEAVAFPKWKATAKACD